MANQVRSVVPRLIRTVLREQFQGNWISARLNFSTMISENYEHVRGRSPGWNVPGVGQRIFAAISSHARWGRLEYAMSACDLLQLRSIGFTFQTWYCFAIRWRTPKSKSLALDALPSLGSMMKDAYDHALCCYISNTIHDAYIRHLRILYSRNDISLSWGLAFCADSGILNVTSAR